MFPSDARFAHINIDFIGPLPPSEGYTYCMTIIDRFTRWPEVIPTTNITAETSCKALIHNWIPRFGCPVTITIDQESSNSLLSTPTSTHKIEDAPSPIYAPENEPAIVKPITTRSGRHVHFPKRLITVM
ncbi:hypothetical protein AVEN_141210-1 [Araneus ventricosus]|uniref:Integrase catalytic domain-containing protein n=1 Tax=Araneus ventricosus TaxID=182803 RepID=A0A4Y2VTQ6_ARAVE|nr:hypothetical protein AVEN_141210-1 [Araneus ventricosus]